MMTLKRSLGACLLAVLVSSAASGQQFDFPLSPLQEVQAVPVVSNASGTGSVLLDATNNLLSWNIQFSGINTSVIGAHFHAPAAAGSNATVVIDIGNISGLTSPLIGAAPISDLQEQQILDGLWYTNIHSMAFPMGEIRGQVVPEPATIAMVAVGLAASAGIRSWRKRRHQ